MKRCVTNERVFCMQFQLSRTVKTWSISYTCKGTLSDLLGFTRKGGTIFGWWEEQGEGNILRKIYIYISILLKVLWHHIFFTLTVETCFLYRSSFENTHWEGGQQKKMKNSKYAPRTSSWRKRLRNSAVTTCYRSACNKAVDYKAKVVFLDHLFFPHNEQNVHSLQAQNIWHRALLPFANSVMCRLQGSCYGVWNGGSPQLWSEPSE